MTVGIADALDLGVVHGVDGADDAAAQRRLFELGLILEPLRRIDLRREILGDGAASPSRFHSSWLTFAGRCSSRMPLTTSARMPRMASARSVGAHELGALLVDDLALIVGDVVEREQLLAHVEVVRLDLALRLLDLPREHAALDDLAFLHAGQRQPAASCESDRRRCA